LNAPHSFREGNGRAQREFVSHLAHAAGYYIAWENVSRADLLQASIESFKGNTSKLAALIRDNLYPLDRDASPPANGPKPPPPKPQMP
jgi:cell filamentation protein